MVEVVRIKGFVKARILDGYFAQVSMESRIITAPNCRAELW